MAGDTRESSSLQSPPTFDTFSHPPSAPSAPPSANALPPGSGLNTAGAHIGEPPKLTDAVKTVRMGDLKQVYMYPCVRESLLFGIGGGFGVGGLRWVMGVSLARAANWAAGTFVFTAIGKYELCTIARGMEKAQMKRVVEVMELKKVEQERAMETKRAERRRVKEEGDKRDEEERRKKGWRFW